MRSSYLAVLLGVCLILTATGALAAPGDPAQDLSGTVTDSDGAALAGVRVTAVNLTSLAEISTTTGSSGDFLLNVPDGQYDLVASLSGYEANTTYLNLTVEDDISGLDFTMAEIPGAVQGYITSMNYFVGGATITLSGSSYNYTTTSNQTLGHYSIAGVAPEQYYVIKVTKTGFWTQTYPTPVFVGRGETVMIDFDLEAQDGTLSGRVTDENGAPVEGVALTARQGNFTLGALTNSDGNYSFNEIPAGTYTLLLEREGYVSDEVQVTVEPFESKHMDLTLQGEDEPPSTGFINGYDLSHSLMIVGMLLGLVMMCLSLFLRARAGKKPSVLIIPEEEEEKD